MTEILPRDCAIVTRIFRCGRYRIVEIPNETPIEVQRYSHIDLKDRKENKIRWMGFLSLHGFPVIIGSKEGLNYFPCFKYSFKVNVYLYAQSIFYFILFIINILL